MQYLLLNRSFSPDPSPASVLLTDVARVLAEQDNDVTVLCERSEPAGDGTDHTLAVRVIRVCDRSASSFSFLLGSLAQAMRLPPQDAVVCTATLPWLGALALLVKYVRGSRLVLWDMDSRPEDHGGKLQRAVSRFVRQHADAIVAAGEDARASLIDSGLPPEAVHVAESWTGASLPARAPGGPLRLRYSENLTMTHDLAMLESAIQEEAPDERFEFAVAGDLAAADIGLVTETAAPNQVYGLLAAGRPVLFVGSRESTQGRLIERSECGWRVDADDRKGLQALLGRLASNPDEVKAAGAQARATFEAAYDVPQAAGRVARIIRHQGAREAAATIFRLPSVRLSVLALTAWAVTTGVWMAARSSGWPAAVWPAFLVFVPCSVLSFRSHRTLCAAAVVGLGLLSADVNLMVLHCFGATFGYLAAKTGAFLGRERAGD